MKSILFIFIILITHQIFNYAQSTNKIPVLVTYDIDSVAENEILIRSLIERELRSLGDVEIVTDYSEKYSVLGLKFTVVAVELNSSDAIKGYVVFYIATIMPSKPYEEPFPLYLRSNWVTGSPDDIGYIVSELVADYDQTVLKEWRK